MNKIDDILDRLKSQQPVIDDPDALTERIMSSLPDNATTEQEEPEQAQPTAKARVVGLRMRWIAAAACLLLLVGVGTTLTMKEGTTNTMVAAKDSVVGDKPVVAPVVADLKPAAHVELGNLEAPATSAVNPTNSVPATATAKAAQTAEMSVPTTKDAHPTPDADADPNLHYASLQANADTIAYQDPARVDEFIAKFAGYYKVEQGVLECSIPKDSNVVSSVYVFPDKKEIDVFGRLLQVACWYSDETPGYLLNFSHLQFYFELKDLRKQLQYRWIAERVNGKILLYSTCSPIESTVSSACYQEFREELMHAKSINTKPRDI